MEVEDMHRWCCGGPFLPHGDCNVRPKVARGWTGLGRCSDNWWPHITSSDDRRWTVAEKIFRRVFGSLIARDVVS